MQDECVTIFAKKTVTILSSLLLKSTEVTEPDIDSDWSMKA